MYKDCNSKKAPCPSVTIDEKERDIRHSVYHLNQLVHKVSSEPPHGPGSWSISLGSIATRMLFRNTHRIINCSHLLCLMMMVMCMVERISEILLRAREVYDKKRKRSMESDDKRNKFMPHIKQKESNFLFLKMKMDKIKK